MAITQSGRDDGGEAVEQVRRFSSMLSGAASITRSAGASWPRSLAGSSRATAAPASVIGDPALLREAREALRAPARSPASRASGTGSWSSVREPGLGGELGDPRAHRPGSDHADAARRLAPFPADSLSGHCARATLLSAPCCPRLDPDERARTDGRAEIDDAVCTLTLNRPEAMNAITTELADELRVALGEGAEEADVILVQGAGGNFCAGGDFHHLQEIRSDPARAARALRGLLGRVLADRRAAGARSWRSSRAWRWLAASS